MTESMRENGEKLSLPINVMEGDQVRADLAAIACQQLKEVGVDAKAQVQIRNRLGESGSIFDRMGKPI